MKIAIVGATGMIGHHSALAAAAAGHAVRLVHRESSAEEHLPVFADGVEVDSAIASLGDTDVMRTALEGCDAVINCAGYYPPGVPKGWQQEVDIALAEMRSFYEACEGLDLKKIVYLGAAIALPLADDGYGHADLHYEQPPNSKNAYLQVKWALDELAKQQAEAGLPVVIGIPSMTFGEYDWKPTTGRLVVEIGNGNLPAFVPGKRNVIYAGDAGRGLVMAAESGKPGERYLFTNENMSMKELVGTIATAASTFIPQGASLGAAKMVSRWQHLKHKMGGAEPLLTSTAIAVMSAGQFLDGKKAREELGFVAEMPIDETIRKTVRWFRQNDYITL